MATRIYAGDDIPALSCPLRALEHATFRVAGDLDFASGIKDSR